MRHLAIAAAMGAAFVAAPAQARAPINQWLCDVLKPPFDPAAALASFPLEKLPTAEETRKDKPRDDGSTRTSVVLRAEGERYAVEYRYLFNSTDVSSPYGFSLQIEETEVGGSEFADQTERWLREWGRPVDTAIGDAVFAGPAMYEGGPSRFKFERWNVTGDYTADWFNRGDIRYAAELCK